MSTRKPKKSPRTFAVRYRYVSLCETMIKAENEVEAREKFDAGDWGDVLELDTIDHEVISVKEERG